MENPNQKTNLIMSLILNVLSFFLSLLRLRELRNLAKCLGSIAYFFHSSYKKMAQLNLYRAFPHFSVKKRNRVALQAYQSLFINYLEIFWFSRHKVNKYVSFVDESEVLSRLEQGHGVIFFGGHQANWETVFPILNLYCQGIVIGKPFKNNSWLYNFLLSFRQMNGGKVVHPKNAIQESLKTLQNGKWIIFADHTFRRRSNYTYPLFGHPAYTSLAPSLLAYRTKNPIVVLMGKRTEQGYTLTFSPMIFPNVKNFFKQEAPRLMDIVMTILERSIAEKPEEWPWMHNRWRIRKKLLRKFSLDGMSEFPTEMIEQ